MKQLRIIVALILVGVAIYFFVSSVKNRPIHQEVVIPKVNTNQLITNTLNQDDIQISNFSLTANGEIILKTLGEPAERHQATRPKSQPGQKTYIDTWNYPGLELQFITTLAKSEPAPKLPGTLSKAILTGTKYETKRGIRIGDPEIKVLELYGNAKKESDTYTYGLGNLFLMKFIIAGEKVARIEVTVDLN